MLPSGVLLQPRDGVRGPATTPSTPPRALLASGKLGQHNGLPASIIITTTLKDLESAPGHELTGGGSILSMSDVSTTRLARPTQVTDRWLAGFDAKDTATVATALNMALWRSSHAQYTSIAFAEILVLEGIYPASVARMQTVT